MEEKMISLSFSGWKDADCPFRFHKCRIERSHREPESDAMRIGSEMAHIVKCYREHCYQAGLTSDLTFFDRVKVDERYKEEIGELIEKFKASEFVNVPLAAEWVRIESKMAFNDSLVLINGDERQAWEHPRAAFRAVCDFAYRQGDTLYIIDDKTGRADPDPLQLELYSYLARVAYQQSEGGAHGLARVVCIFNEIAKRSKQVMEFDPLQTNVWRARIQERIRDVNSWTEFPAKACDQCRYCTIPDCPLRQSAATSLMEAAPSPTISLPTEIATKEDAEKAVLFLSFLAEIEDRVENLLKVFVQEHGSVSAGGKIAELRDQTDGWSPRDTESVASALCTYISLELANKGASQEDARVRAKRIVFDAMSLTRSAVEEACRKGRIKERLPMILAMGESKPKAPRFGLYAHRSDPF